MSCNKRRWLQQASAVFASLAVFASFAVLASLAGCGPGDPPAVVRIGVLAKLSGTAGQVTTEAARLAVESVNAAGGLEIDGRRHRVELLFEDTNAAPNQAIAGARRLIQQQVVAIVGPNRSRDAIAAARAAQNARVPMISPNSTHPETTAGLRYSFRMTCTDAFQGQALGRFAAETLGATSAAVLYDVASAYNQSLATVFRQAFEGAGGKVVAFENYTTDESTFEEQLGRIRDLQPQVLLLPNYQEEIPVQALQARALGVEAILLGGDSWALMPFAELPQLEGAFFGLHWHPAQTETNPLARDFAILFREAYGHDPTDLAALIYDAFSVLFDAIELAGPDPDKIHQTLEDLEGYRGVTGLISYRGTEGDPPKALIIGQVKQGEVVLYEEVEPLP